MGCFFKKRIYMEGDNDAGDKNNPIPTFSHAGSVCNGIDFNSNLVPESFVF
jgi:hypothetical protein